MDHCVRSGSEQSRSRRCRRSTPIRLVPRSSLKHSYFLRHMWVIPDSDRGPPPRDLWGTDRGDWIWDVRVVCSDCLGRWEGVQWDHTCHSRCGRSDRGLDRGRHVLSSVPVRRYGEGYDEGLNMGSWDLSRILSFPSSPPFHPSQGRSGTRSSTGTGLFQGKTVLLSGISRLRSPDPSHRLCPTRKFV